MTYYQMLIGSTLDTSDVALIAVVEMFMREGRSALDGLSRDQFAHEALSAYADVLELHGLGDLDYVCNANGLAVPNLTTV